MSLALFLFFGFTTNWSGSLVRALVFSSLVLGAEMLEIKSSRLWLFLWSVTITACLGLGSQLGFLLSTLCVLSFALFPGSRLASFLAPALFSMPVLLWNFGLVSLAAPLWNFVFGAWIGFFSLPVAILGTLCNRWTWSTLMLQFCERSLSLMMQHLDRLQAFSLSFSAPRKEWAVLFLVCLMFLFAQKKWQRISATGLVVFVLMIHHFYELKLSFLDVGQGDSALLLLANQHRLLLDFGPEKGWKQASSALSLKGVAHLDDLLLTHPDMDHRGGIRSLLTKISVLHGIWFRSDMLQEKGMIDLLLALEQANIAVYFLDNTHQPQGLQCWLAPAVTRNDFSPLCLAHWNEGLSALFTGDMDFAAERNFLLKKNLPRAKILKIAHHGSATSTLPDFLAAIHPQEAIISVGRKNPYGHPTPACLHRIEAQNSKIRRTDLEGTIDYYQWTIFQKR